MRRIALMFIAVSLLVLVNLPTIEAQDDPCTVTSSTNVNIRTEPSTDAGILGVLSAGESQTVSSRVEDADGFTWWNLASGGWVREDVVQESGDCASSFDTTLSIDLELVDQLYAEIFSFSYNTGLQSFNQGRYEEAILIWQALLFQIRVAEDKQNEVSVLNNIGFAFMGLREYPQALNTFFQALDVAIQIANLEAQAILNANISGIYVEQRRYNQALTGYEEALLLYEMINDSRGMIVTLINIATIYGSVGNYSQSSHVLTQALDYARTIENQYYETVILDQIGDNYRLLNQHELASTHYLDALQVARSIDNERLEVQILISIGLNAASQDRHRQAIDIFSEALQIAETTDDSRGRLRLLVQIATSNYRLGEFAAAIENYQTILEDVQYRDDLMAQATTLFLLGNVYDNGLNEPTRAIEYYAQSFEIDERVIGSGATNSNISEYIQGTINISSTRLTILLIEQGDLPFALEYAERGRSILSRDELRNAPIDFRANITDESLLEEEQRLRLALIDAQNFVAALERDLSATNADVQQARTALNDARSAYDRHIERMQLEGGFIARELALDVASLDEIQAALPPDTTLLLYGLSDAETNQQTASYVLLVTADDLRGFVFDVGNAEINEAVRSFAANRSTNVDMLSELYDLVFAPIADEITTENLIISPDGVLNYVPFAALQAPDGTYLIDEFVISMTPSGTALALLNERQPTTPATSPGVTLAQSQGPPSLPLLQSVNSESESVADSLGINAILDATESDLRANIVGAEVVHISAHAELDPFAPLFSAIYLGSDEEHDGRLEVREIYELDLLQGTELVILSGCDTASGGAGEDFGLLTRAFFGAGADRVVASLWPVDDAATSSLISTYLTFRESGDYASDAVALRAAMLETREQYDDPYLWASFVLVGEP